MTERQAEKSLKGQLYEKLEAYGQSDYYGFHMPGHKRRMGYGENPYQIDITEIHGFDDLHHPEQQGLLVQAQERAARLYGAEETHFLVNGSTAGILSAVCGCTSLGGQLLMARNSHRSAFHAAELGSLHVSWLYPHILEKLWINGGISPEDVEKSLCENPGIEAVFVTSPSYEGICLDVKALAECCHRHGVPLIVDQAHGAHFPFSAYFPEDALKAGADVVVQSIHKTLPALTQTALLHMQGELADRQRIRHYLSVFQSSSPSYILMASIDSCMELLEQKGAVLFEEYVQRLEAFRRNCRSLKRLRLLGGETAGKGAVCDFDRSRLVISTQGTAMTGEELAERLRREYHLEMELAADAYVVGISTVADTEAAFGRLQEALGQIEEGIEPQAKRSRTVMDGKVPEARAACGPGEALQRKKEWTEISRCENRIAAEYVYLYPPGIPLLVPGEILTPQICSRIKTGLLTGQKFQGLKADGRMAVLV